MAERFETNRDPRSLFSTSARIATALINRICPRPCVLRKDGNSSKGSIVRNLAEQPVPRPQEHVQQREKNWISRIAPRQNRIERHRKWL